MTEVTRTSAVAILDDAEVAGRRVLVRVDFNVPMRHGEIADDRRIRAALPTIEELRRRDARTLLCTHLGRPKGERDPSLSTEPLARRLGELLGTEVRWVDDVAGDAANELSQSLRGGEVGMLQNVRFESGETKNDEELARRLAALADIYVDDAFGAAHRAHASTEGVTHHIPGFAGRLMQRELEVLGSIFEHPVPPVVAILGGSKISTKLGVLRSLAERVDTLWIGGAMACTFFRAKGWSTGTSLVEEDQIPAAKALLDNPGRASLRLPTDVVIAERAEAGAPARTVAADAIPSGWMVVDVGADTVAAAGADCEAAGTIVWNGPLGIYEIPAFARGTRTLAEAVGRSHATSIVGGGDLAAALDEAGVADSISHVSTGGGATLEFLEGKVLPGVAALRRSAP